MNSDVEKIAGSVDEKTRSLLNNLKTNALSSQMHSLNIDGPASNISLNSTNNQSMPLNTDSMSLMCDSFQL